MQIPSELIEYIANERCVLFVGSGLSKHARSLPLWKEFVRQVRDRITQDPDEEATDENIDQYRLEYLEYAKLHHTARYKQAIKDLLSTSNKIVSDPHRLIAELPFVAIITTNLDSLIEDAFRAASLTPFVVSEDDDIAQIADKKGVLVIKMHGSVNSNKQVLTFSEYQDFDLKRHTLKALILSYLSQYPMLVMGAGLTDPNFLKLYSIVHNSFRGFQQPVYYVYNKLPAFVKSVWKQRSFKFISVPPTETTNWLRKLVREVNLEKQSLVRRGGPASVNVYLKEKALHELGAVLGDYEALQTRYTSRVHMPDYGWFANRWEYTLYAPLRVMISQIVQRLYDNGPVSMFYGAPGPHAPVLMQSSSSDLYDKLIHIILMDIDPDVISRATERLKGILAPNGLLNNIVGDFTGGLGNSLCIVLNDLFEKSNTGDRLLSELGPIEEILTKIIDSAGGGEQVLNKILKAVAHQEIFEKMSITYSEMIASFAATPVLMALRTRVYQFLPGEENKEIRDKIMGKILSLWQRFNDYFFKLHLQFLSRLTIPGGEVIVAADTEKLYDDHSEPPVYSFSTPIPQVPALSSYGLEFRHTEDLYWQDHEFGFDAKVAGVPVPDFKSHWHKVLVLCYRKFST